MGVKIYVTSLMSTPNFVVLHISFHFFFLRLKLFFTVFLSFFLSLSLYFFLSLSHTHTHTHTHTHAHTHKRIVFLSLTLLNRIKFVSQTFFCLDHPMDRGQTTPTSAHASLKTIVDGLIEETETNPFKQVFKLTFTIF